MPKRDPILDVFKTIRNRNVGRLLEAHKEKVETAIARVVSAIETYNSAATYVNAERVFHEIDQLERANLIQRRLEMIHVAGTSEASR